MRERSDRTDVRDGASMIPMAERPRRPRDPNQLAKLVVDLATGAVEETPNESGKDTKMSELGRRGGLKGGYARAALLTAEQRSDSARKAAKARWDKSS
jgi:hypothetical protein